MNNNKQNLRTGITPICDIGKSIRRNKCSTQKGNKKFLWESIASDLEDLIAKKGVDGALFFSADEICSRYKVSKITSSRALSELAKKHFIRRVKGKGSFITREEKSCAFEILLLIDLDEGTSALRMSYILSEVFKGIITEAMASNAVVKTVTPSYFEMLDLDKVSGLNVIIMQELPKNKNLLEFLKSERVNCVCCHAYSLIEGIATVRDGLREGAFLAVSHLIEKGHRRIAFLTAKESLWFMSRFEGYRDALLKHKLNLSFGLIKECDFQDFADVTKAMDKLISNSEPPTAIFGVSDLYALPVIKYCNQKNIRVPEDIAVVGLDNRPEAVLSCPPLTTVDTRWEEQGRQAVKLIKEISIKRESKLRDVVVKPFLVVRESSAAKKEITHNFLLEEAIK